MAHPGTATAAFALLAALFAPAQDAHATAYPWTEGPAASQVILLPDSKVDLALRLAFIARARYTIDAATYVQSLDGEFGRPVIGALREAANRRVRVRYMIDRLGSGIFDPLNLASEALTDKRLALPPQVVSFDQGHKARAGINLTDKMHWKVLIIDAGTPHEVIFLGGRNHGWFDLRHLDMGVLIRPFNAGAEHVGRQVAHGYDDLFETLARNGFLYRNSGVPLPFSSPNPAAGERALSAIIQDPAIAAEYRSLRGLFAFAPDRTAPLHRLETRPARMRFLTNDLLQQALTRVHGNTFASRGRTVESDILSAATEAARGATRRLDMASMIVAIPPHLKDALMERLAARLAFEFLSNSRETMKTYVPTGFAFDLSLKDLRDLAAAGPGFAPYLMNRSKDPDLRYSHIKAFIADDVSILGMDNFNMTSFLRNAEASLQVDDAAFAAMLRREVALMRDAHFTPLGCAEMLAEGRRDNVLKRALNRLLLSVY